MKRAKHCWGQDYDLEPIIRHHRRAHRLRLAEVRPRALEAVVNGTPIKLLGDPLGQAILGANVTFNCLESSPFANMIPGEMIWVRERLKIAHADGAWMYAHDRAPIEVHKDKFSMDMIYWSRWQKRDNCSAIHMPRWASRITLEVISVRVRGKIATVLCKTHNSNIDRIAA